MSRKQSSGFTLVELVMVIVVLGILAAVILPKFIDLSSDAQTAVNANSAAVTQIDAQTDSLCTALGKTC